MEGGVRTKSMKVCPQDFKRLNFTSIHPSKKPKCTTNKNGIILAKIESNHLYVNIVVVSCRVTHAGFWIKTAFECIKITGANNSMNNATLLDLSSLASARSHVICSRR